LKSFLNVYNWIIPTAVYLFLYNSFEIVVFSKNNMRSLSKSNSKKIAENTLDMYSKEILKQQYEIHKNYVISRKNSSNILNISFRLPCIPEDISENMIKFIIHKNGDNTSSWNCKGDLLSSIEGKQECKCFTSTGPISFTPSSEWDSIYFLDATQWLNDSFKLYKFPYKRTSDEWKNIKVNKNQTFEDQSLQGRRPRINWLGLYPQIKEKCSLIFEGSFEDIIVDCSDTKESQE
jgi:hypothetical protein